MNTCKCQSVFINSKNRISGSINDFVINLEDEAVCSDKNTSLRLNVVGVTMSRSWYSTKQFTFKVVTGSTESIYTILEGNYNVYTFLDKLKALLKDWVIIYDQIENKFHFNSPSPSKFVFDNDYEHMFGFQSKESITGTNIISEIAIDMTKQQSVFIHSNLLKRRMSAIDNNLESKFVESDIICIS